MKMPTLPKMKMPKLPKLPKPQPKRLQATARRAAQPAVDDYDEEPTTRLSSAFVVVLILHIVAVGGIYAFNSIKAHRRGQDMAVAPAPSNTPLLATAGPTEQATVAEPASQAAPAVEQAPSPTPATTPTPAVAAHAAAPEAAPVPATPVAPISGNRIYHVRSGDTLWRIASVYDVSLEELAAANGLTLDSKLQLGRVLNIPASKGESKATAPDTRKSETASAKKAESPNKTASSSKPSTPAKASLADTNPKTYTVKKGDNPVAIAKKFGVSYDELLKLNKISDPRRLQINQVLKLPQKKGN